MRLNQTPEEEDSSEFFYFMLFMKKMFITNTNTTINSHCIAKRFLFSCGYCSASHKLSLISSLSMKSAFFSLTDFRSSIKHETH